MNTPTRYYVPPNSLIMNPDHMVKGLDFEVVLFSDWQAANDRAEAAERELAKYKFLHQCEAESSVEAHEKLESAAAASSTPATDLLDTAEPDLV